MFTVAVYLVDRAYGGPEEGGWWYTYGELDDAYAQFTRGFGNERSAQTYRNRLENKLCRYLNRGRRSIDSVLSTGQYQAYLTEGQPKNFPAQRPHYE